MSFHRLPGTPLPAPLVRELREKSGLSQSGFAERLGLRSGKTTISAWENGRTPCEGPVAELIILLFGNVVDVLAHPFLDRASKVWRRTKHPVLTWRQVTVMPSVRTPLSLDLLSDAHSVAIKDAMVEWSFPFWTHRGRVVAELAQDGWVATLPFNADSAPRYLWQLDPRGFFLYREYLWEAEPRSRIPHGISVQHLLQAALLSTTYYRRLAAVLRLDSDCPLRLRMDIAGAAGRGFVMPEALMFATPPATERWDQHHLWEARDTTLGALAADPVKLAIQLVASTVATLDAADGVQSRMSRALNFCRQPSVAGIEQSTIFEFLDHLELPAEARSHFT